MPTKYLIVNVGYQHLAIPYDTGAQLAGVVAMLADARQVTSHGYGDEQRWTPDSNMPPEMQFADGSRVTVGDEVATLKAQLEAKTREADDRSRYWTEERAKSKALSDELAAIKAQQVAHLPNDEI